MTSDVNLKKAQNRLKHSAEGRILQKLRAVRRKAEQRLDECEKHEASQRCFSRSIRAERENKLKEPDQDTSAKDQIIEAVQVKESRDCQEVIYNIRRDETQNRERMESAAKAIEALKSVSLVQAQQNLRSVVDERLDQLRRIRQEAEERAKTSSRESNAIAVKAIGALRASKLLQPDDGTDLVEHRLRQSAEERLQSRPLSLLFLNILSQRP